MNLFQRIYNFFFYYGFLYYGFSEEDYNNKKIKGNEKMKLDINQRVQKYYQGHLTGFRTTIIDKLCYPRKPPSKEAKNKARKKNKLSRERRKKSK